MTPPPPLQRVKQSAVFQAVALFLGASWLVLQVVDILTERLGLPTWVFPVALILLAVGLVVVLATAWVQSRPATTAAEDAGELPTDWEIAPADAFASLRSGRLPHLNWARVILGGVLALSLLFGFAGAYVLATGGGPRLGPAEIGADETSRGVAILPFSVNSAELEPWEVGIVDLLSPGLDGVAGLRTIASRTVLSRWNEAGASGNVDLDAALRIAGETGARYAMTGTVVALGPTVRLNAEVYDLVDGRKVAEGGAEGSADEVLALVDELGLDVMRDLMGTVSGEGVRDGLPARLTTTSLAAARAFLEGEEHYRDGRFDEAVLAYEEALAADSSFALPAYRAYLSLLYVGNGEQQRAMDARLRPLLPNLPARDRALARLRLEISGDSLESAEPAELAVQRYPDDAEAWYVLGEVRYHEPGMAGGGHGPAREAFDRAIELSPGFIPYYYHSIDYAIGAGERERAQELLGVLAEAVPDDREVERYRLAIEVFTGDLEEIRPVVRTRIDEVMDLLYTIPMTTELIPRAWAVVSGLPTQGDVRATDFKSAWAMAVGRQEEALELMRSIPLGNRRRVTLARHHQDVLGTLPGFDLDEEFDTTNCGVKDVPGPAACHEKAALRAVDAGRPGDARRTIVEQDSIADSYESYQSGSIHRRYARTIEGYLAWKTGDPSAALRAFQAARQLDRFAVTARWYLAEVLAEAGRPLDSVELFLSIDDSPTWSPFARLRAAEVLEGMGDAEGARTHYRAALAAWGQADEGFEPKERAVAGLARTGG